MNQISTHAKKISTDTIASSYRLAHNEMRSIDGLQPSDALDELLKYLLYKTTDEKSPISVEQIHALTPKKIIEHIIAEIRLRYRNYLNSHTYVQELFQSHDFRMSDHCLAKVHEILGGIHFKSLSFDIRSAALRSFLSADLRKGLGIFLTPDEVVEEIVSFFQFSDNATIVDPACGSGTFLISAARHAASQQKQISIIGMDKSPRMMLIAQLNMVHSSPFSLKWKVCDTLRYSEYKDWIPFSSADYILTNPPFGVTVDHRSYPLADFMTARSGNGSFAKRQSSELLFLEQSVKLLKPDGWVGIVLPRSVINSFSNALGRSVLGQIATVRALITLPPETFSATGTMTNTVVIFAQKFGNSLTPKNAISPVVARIDNVGFDSTGRVRKGSQLPGLGSALRSAVLGRLPDPRITILDKMPANLTFEALPHLVRNGLPKTTMSADLKPLSHLVHCASTGATPSRQSYSDKGLFLVKVGNLTGAGIRWIPRDRNYIASASANRRYTKEHMRLQPSDILLTSSAHSPKYIAKKIDIITDFPEWTGGSASYVGEVMLLRPKIDLVDPFILLAYLRLPSVISQIQSMIRGQTAHLHPGDLLELPIDMEILNKNSEIKKLALLAKKEAEINVILNQTIWEQLRLSHIVSNKATIPEVST